MLFDSKHIVKLFEGGEPPGFRVIRAGQWQWVDRDTQQQEVIFMHKNRSYSAKRQRFTIGRMHSYNHGIWRGKVNCPEVEAATAISTIYRTV